MRDDMRASAVRKLRALADRLQAGEDVGELFYSYDPGEGCTFGMSASLAQANASAILDSLRDEAAEGWHEFMTRLEWGIVLPIEVCRLVEVQPTPGGEFDERADYALVDPDTYTYTGPTELPADPLDDSEVV